MLEKLSFLTVKEHSRLRFQPKVDFSFAKTQHTCPLLATELFAAASSYPIVFPAEGTIIPQAILSAKPNENNLIGENGEWVGRYLPLHFRRYPFFLGREKKSDQSTLLIDAAAPQFDEKEGKLLYNKRGDTYSASQTLKDIKTSLIQFDEQFQKTQALCKLLKNANVLEPAKLTLTNDGKSQTIRGFSVVSWKKVQELDDATLANWSRIGLIQLIHCHLQSINGIAPARNKTAEPAKTEAKPQAKKKVTAKKAAGKAKKAKK
ncbi:SapC-like protein [Oleiphilus messinensis]|uniref:SapC-like protein n=1 Tax=Oleiphilus messinensis TaxID=141451 RepID=A0A1Y0I3H1_9GAMM|nr:SapC family protein [Oleiphilus messinensis]ARU55022.1 SapC-like protein [Oleiphilus messinensis]